MPKLNLLTVQSGYYTSTALNAIFEQIELEFDKVLYRINPVSTPNSMTHDIDMNGNDVLNGGSAFFDNIVLRGIDFSHVAITISNYLTQAEAARDAAQASEIAAAGSASSSSSSASAAASSASAASTSASNASTSASLAAASEAQALASANSAATYESGAAGHAAAALASQIAAATSETNAAASEAVVLASEANVISLEASVQALSAQFRGTYYGEAPSDPTLDPLGNAPTAGDLYFNTTTSTLRLFDGVAWNLASVDPSTLGSASAYNVGVAANQIPTNGDLGTAATKDVATETEALAGTADVLVTAEQARAVIAQDAPTKTGAGASGTWRISVTGNSATATKLATARTINGILFDGSANIIIPVSAFWPVGATYIQFPGRSAPSALFGGTWSQLFNTEGVFFRTEGGNARAFGGGIQPGAMQNFTGSLANVQLQSPVTNTSNGVIRFQRSGGGNTSGTYSCGTLSIDASRQVSTASETRPINRTIRVWVRTA